MAGTSVFALIQAEFDAAQKGLKDVDENIKRLTGRNPEEFRNQNRRTGVGPQAGNQEEGQGRDRTVSKNGAGQGGQPPAKRRNFGSAFSRLGPAPQIRADESGDEEDLPRKGTVQSSVVAAPAKDASRTRKEASAEQKGDKRCMERNKRMFGMILGTLQKFQNEETRRKEQAQSQKRAEIEQKLEEAAEKEKAQLRKERQDLFVARREKQQSLRRLEQKLEIARLHEEAEARQRLLLNFIHTKTKPHIMYKPAKHNTETQKRLKESQKRVLGIIESRRLKAKEELDAIDEQFRRGAPVTQVEEEEMGENEASAVVAEDTGDKENRVKEEGVEVKEMVTEPVEEDSQNNGPAQVKEEPMETEVSTESATVETEQVADASAEPADPQTTSADSTDAKLSVVEEDSNLTSDLKAKEQETEASLLTPVETVAIEALGDQGFEPIYDE
ncbi:pinin-like [Ornithodoros turicata]|uniref:pinin-like n=1 Tax=Ornithodoros turicata TaxID=34597 RepID=UPI003138E026